MDVQKPTPRKQHFVPQFLLREWATDEPRTQMWVYDKLRGQARKQNVRDTATQSDYYEVLVEAGAMEALLSKLESAASLVFARICSDNSLRSMDLKDVHNAALFMVVQAVRTPSFFSSTQRVLGADGDSVLIPRRTTPLLTDVKRINEAAALVREKLWTLRIAPHENEYLFSDHPLGFTAHRGEQIRGFADAFRSTTIHMPISPVHCLLLFPEQKFWIPGTRQVKNGFVLDEVQESTPEEVLSLNTYQVVMSNRFVFDRSGSFAFVEDCLQRNPAARNGSLTTDVGRVNWATDPRSS
ncbi:MAG: DUF4238 domain-containing protein [Phycisphaerales bacterium]